ncbi:hypothetical protein ANCDUO_20482 [Ancylostoma duodenale]|uniref:Uncharacterized protein n=1 Tax=Ancylostoma duodenale TaxID=51022 RepID=A0A0C2BZR4_9BILA|nr:hypothetical protein ANCDUO_20482 [Ancylostoma duodenale]
MFKDNCFPKPSGGCKCNVDLGKGEEVVEYSSDDQCKKSVESQTAENKKELNQEIKEKFGDFKENCFPKPSGGCKCNEKDAQGNEVVTAYNNPSECRIVGFLNYVNGLN